MNIEIANSIVHIFSRNYSSASVLTGDVAEIVINVGDKIFSIRRFFSLGAYLFVFAPSFSIEISCSNLVVDNNDPNILRVAHLWGEKMVQDVIVTSYKFDYTDPDNTQEADDDLLLLLLCAQ